MDEIKPNEVLPTICIQQESLIPTQYKSTTSYHKYLNSGVAAGRVSAYKGIFASLWKLLEMKVTKRCSRFLTDDQAMIGYLYSNQEAPIAVDHNFTLFGTIISSSFEIDKEAQKWSLSTEINTVDSQGLTKRGRRVSYPFAVHLAGAGGLMHKFKNGLFRANFAKRRDWEDYLATVFVYVNGEKTLLKDVCDIHRDRSGAEAT
jgi:hypothetical protein